jgi:DNA-binding response OmpR family regulator
MKSILIVDDERSIVVCMTQALTPAGYEVFGVADVRHALRVLDIVEVDLIIADLIMPDIEGLEFIRRIKNDKEKNLKIIAMSGGGVVKADDYLKLALRLGADATLKKPFKMEELLEVVRRIVD